MKAILRTMILLMSSALQIVMKSFIPVAGGGASVILIVSIPVLIALGIIFTLIDCFLIRKINSQRTRNLLFLLLECILIGMAIWSYPFI